MWKEMIKATTVTMSLFCSCSSPRANKDKLYVHCHAGQISQHKTLSCAINQVPYSTSSTRHQTSTYTLLLNEQPYITKIHCTFSMGFRRLRLVSVQVRLHVCQTPLKLTLMKKYAHEWRDGILPRVKHIVEQEVHHNLIIPIGIVAITTKLLCRKIMSH